MKNLLLGLVLTATAVGGSSFTNSKKVVTENFLIQLAHGIYIRANQANGSCIPTGGGMECKFVITDLGRWYIPSKTLYFAEDINEYISEGWLQYSPTSTEGLYLIL
jgi:hypothetical protein